MLLPKKGPWGQCIPESPPSLISTLLSEAPLLSQTQYTQDKGIYFQIDAHL